IHAFSSLMRCIDCGVGCGPQVVCWVPQPIVTPTLAAAKPRTGESQDKWGLIGLLVVYHLEDDIADFALCFHIAMRFGGLFQTVAAIDHRTQLACFKEFVKEGQIFPV